MKRVRFLALVTVILCILPSNVANASSDIDLTWPEIPAGSSVGATIVESIGYSQGYSHLYVWNGSSEIGCSGLTDSHCKKYPDKDWGMVRILPLCIDSPATDDCIEGLDVTSGSQTLPAKLIRKVESPNWPADTKTGLISGGQEALWSNPFTADTNTGISIKGRAYYSNKSGSLTNQDWRMKDFTITATPYQVVTGNFKAVRTLPKSSLPIDQITGDFQGDWAWQFPPASCIWAEDGVCGTRAAFQNIDRLTLKVHLANTQTSWLGGRLVAPEIKVTKFNSKVNHVSISAAPAEVGFVQAFPTSTTAAMTNWSLEHQGGSFSSWLFDTVSSFLGVYRTYLGDKVTKMIGTWSVTNGFGAPTNKCLISNSKILGLVTTNATTYQASAPTFSNGFLKYQVASLHYQPNGELNLGSYDLLIDSKAARCLYGFTSAPVSATIQVIDNNGVTETATTSLSEKNGWIKLSAKGFTFSNPIIRVKLTQVKAKKK